MTEFTKDHPFEFEGLFIYRAGLFDNVIVEDRLAPRMFDFKAVDRNARALHAFIEAESAEWRWVEEGAVARKGRWTAELQEDVWVFIHDDFTRPGRGPSPYWTRIVGSGERRVDDVATVVMDSFDTWLAAQSQPAEPTTFGYVGTVTDDDGDVWDASRDGGGEFMLTRRRDGFVRARGLETWPGVLALGTFEPKGDGR